MIRCSKCKKNISENDFVVIEKLKLCARCKSLQLQKMREGYSQQEDYDYPFKSPKSLKTHLAEIFLRQSFIDSKSKKAHIKNCFIHDMKWFAGYALFIVAAFLMLIIFGVR